MASTASKTPLLRTLAARGYAAKAKVAPSPAIPLVQTTALPNKMVVTSVETCSPISSVSIIFRAGSRNETYDTMGASHMLRSTAGLTNQHSTAFGVTRHIQQVGGSLSCTTDRELVIYNVELTRNHMDIGLKYLDHVATAQIFKPWEIAENWHRVKADRSRINDQIAAIELLHSAAYRNQLGNSLFCPKHQLGKISSETMQHYVATNFTTNRAAVTGVGVDHQLLVGFAKNLLLESGAGNETKSIYYGNSEGRLAKAGDISTVAIAVPGGQLNNVKESMAFNVLQHAIGVGASTKRGGISGALGKQLQTTMSGKHFTYATLNAQYTDHGLFGGVFSACSSDIGKIVETVVQSLRSGSVSSEYILRAKQSLKLRLASELETNEGLLFSISAQSGLMGVAQGPYDILSSIDAITDADVQAAAKKVASGKLSMGSVGNLRNVQYVSDF